MWGRFGFDDLEHFVAWCPGCFGLLVGVIGTAAVMGAAWWLFG